MKRALRPKAKAGKPAARSRVAKHRAAMRAKGMRLVQIWVPDSRSPAFLKEARRQVREAAKVYADPGSEERRILDAFQSIAAWPKD